MLLRRLAEKLRTMLTGLMTRTRLLATLGVLGALALVAGAMLLVWRGPWLLDGKYLDTASLRQGSAPLVTGFRTALVQLLAVMGAGIALVYTAVNYRLTRRGQVTERFTKALERLGSDELYVRFGGILALEQVVRDSPDQSEHAALVLQAFIRERAPMTEKGKGERSRRERIATARRSVLHEARSPFPRIIVANDQGDLPEVTYEDVQQAFLTLMKNPHAPTIPLDFTGLHLPKLWVDGACLSSAKLEGVDLSRASLGGADLRKARLDGAKLRRVGLRKARLEGARLEGVDLSHADLEGADLGGAWLKRSDLRYVNAKAAHLGSATLDRACLSGATFEGADLGSANLSSADTRHVDFRRANLERAYLMGVDLGFARFYGANLKWTDLRGSDLRGSYGLTVDQVLSAMPYESTLLPPEIAQDPRVVKLVAWNEQMAAETGMG